MIDFSPLPVRFKPAFMRYLVAQLHVLPHEKDEAIEITHFPNEPASTNSDAYCARFGPTNDTHYKLIGLAGLSPDKQQPVWGLAGYLHSKKRFSSVVNKRGLSLEAFLLRWQDFVLDEVRGQRVSVHSTPDLMSFDQAWLHVLTSDDATSKTLAGGIVEHTSRYQFAC